MRRFEAKHVPVFTLLRLWFLLGVSFLSRDSVDLCLNVTCEICLTFLQPWDVAVLADERLATGINKTYTSRVAFSKRPSHHVG